MRVRSLAETEQRERSRRRQVQKRKPWTLQRLEDARKHALDNAVSAGSKRSYSSAVQSYLNFCKIHNFPVDPTPNTLSLYVSYTAFYIKPDSVGSYLSGISHALELEFPDARTNRHHPLVKKTLGGCMRLKNSPAEQVAPLSTEDIRKVQLELDSNSSFDDVLFAALLTVGFVSLQRLGELVVPDIHSQREYRKCPMRYSVEKLPEGITYTLPYHKADPFYKGNDIFVPKHSPIPAIDPHAYFEQYLTRRDHLFAYFPDLWLRESGSPPTRSWFLNRLFSHFPERESLGGHSIRSGGATALALAGVADSRIQALGRWASETWRIYVRKHPLLLHALMHPDIQN